MSERFRIGIDPDLKKSGVALISNKPFQCQKVVLVSTLSFFETIDYIRASKEKFDNLIVMIEAGWLNKKSNYHNAFNKEIAGRIGKNVGENHAIGKLLEEFCQIHNIEYKLIKPNTKKWDAKLFKQITKWEGRTNAEMRDAVRSAWL